MHSLPIRVLVVWEPMLLTDWWSPSGMVQSRISDPRVIQYWDKDHLVAKELRQQLTSPPSCCQSGGILWDMAALYPKRAQWGDSSPVFADGPVVKVAPVLEEACWALGQKWGVEMDNSSRSSECSASGLTGCKAAWFLWYLPILLVIVGGSWSRGRIWLWVPAFAVMGVGCLANAALCGRMHCYFTGPLFLVAAIFVALAGLRVAARAASRVPDELKVSLMPLLETISHLNKEIYTFDNAIENVARNQYPATERLRQISGVGPVTAFAVCVDNRRPKPLSTFTRRGSVPWLNATSSSVR